MARSERKEGSINKDEVFNNVFGISVLLHSWTTAPGKPNGTGIMG